MSCGDEFLERDEDHHASYYTKQAAIDKGTKDVLEHKPAKKCSCREGGRERERGGGGREECEWKREKGKFNESANDTMSCACTSSYLNCSYNFKYTKLTKRF